MYKLGNKPHLHSTIDKVKQYGAECLYGEYQERIVKILDRFDTLCNDITRGLPAEIDMRRKQYEYYRDKLLTFKEKETKE